MTAAQPLIYGRGCILTTVEGCEAGQYRAVCETKLRKGRPEYGTFAPDNRRTRRTVAFSKTFKLFSNLRPTKTVSGLEACFCP